MEIRKVTDLRPYSQGKAIEFMLSHPQGGIFLDMGLGKTAAAETVVMELLRFGVGPTLVVGPIRVIETVWRQEAAKWEHLKHLKFSLVRGNVQERRNALDAEADVYLINPEHLGWFFDVMGGGPYKFETLIIDESSMFKNVSSKRFMMLRHKVKHFQRRYILTGTPTPNKLLELWPQIFILDQGERLGKTYTKYKQRFFEPVDHWGYKWEPKEGAKEKIFELIADIVLRIENADAPQITYNPIQINLSEAVMKVYKEVEDAAFSALSELEVVTALNAAGALMKCRQIANGVVYADELEEKSTAKNRIVKIIHKQKLDAMREIIDETGSPVIVVYNFKHELRLIQEELKDLNPVVLAEAKDAEEAIDRWNNGDIPVLLLHPQVGGHGLNLQEGGHTMIWFGLTFSYEQYIQTIARINRQGQRFPVVIHALIAVETVDEFLQEVLAGKAAGQGELFDYLKNYMRR
jgi:SNF2 family DNA or RNA helicase